jgi:superfamily II DNA/RNA helicase
MGFELLGLSDELLKAVADSGYTEPTPIQRAAIPAVLQGRDILGIAQTGTGKTAGFTLPMLDILAQGRARARMPRSLILEPTRELAHQVAESFDRYGKHYKLTKALLIGGVAFGDQDKLLERGVDVLIATPGRLLDQFQRSKILLSGLEILVIDEADRMLDMGFIPDVERICSMLPAKRQTLFFSATMPPPVKSLADRFLRDPKVIEASRPATANTSIAQKLVLVADRQKRDALRSLLRSETVESAIVFCNRKKDVKLLLDSLKRDKFNVAALHGDMEQSDRLKVLDSFKSGETTLLVASDVAARGLDIPSVSHVFNFDVPTHADDYIHRIGRTGRAGRSGTAFTFATAREMELVEAIEKLTSTSIPRHDMAGVTVAEPVAGATTEAKPAARRRTTRPPRAAARSADAVSPAAETLKPELPFQEPPVPQKPARQSRAQPTKADKSTVSPNKIVDEDVATGWGDHVPAFFKATASR